MSAAAAVGVAFALLLGPVPSAQGRRAQVVSVVDGDTVKVRSGGKTETVRIIGIDTPETKDPRKPVQCFGREATAAMRRLAGGKTVSLEAGPEDADKYGRLLRYVDVGGTDAGARMIADGYAFSYKQFPHPRRAAYDALEREARAAKRGLWGDACGYGTAPSRGTVSSPRPGGVPPDPACPIKGNVSAGGKLYHLPGCGSYRSTLIDTSAGERWFCTEADAVAAGWKKAGNC